MNIATTKFYLAPAAALLLALAGCSAAAPGTATATGTPARPIPSMSMGTSPITPAAVPVSAAPSAAAAPAIVISAFAYQGPESVAAGAMVTVTNMDRVAHTVTSDSGSLFDAIVQPRISETFKAPSAPGNYTYHCTYHGNMHGTLVVK